MRKLLGITQQGLADKVGVLRTTLSHWETGETKEIPFPQLIRVSEILGVNARWLTLGDVPPWKAYFPTPEEMLLLTVYQTLSESLQEKAMKYIRKLASGKPVQC